jgi:Ca2+-binding RTX toxin-like protein
MPRPWILVAAAAATIAVSPSAASAATVELVDGTVVFTAAAGERNAVSAGTRVLGPPLRLGIVDNGAPLTVRGTGCTALDEHTAVCGDETTAPTLPVAMDLGDAEDTLFYEEVAGRRELTVRGGAGDDSIRVGSATGFDPVVYGGNGDDTLTANMNVSGTPVLRGGRGDDLLRNIGGSGALMYGEVGDDRLFCECFAFGGGDPSYLLDGGKDDDTYSFGVFDDALVGTASMIVPGSGLDTLDQADAPESLSFAFSGCGRCVEQVRASGFDDDIDARNGLADTVSCGAGVDVVLADRRDKVAGDCESVTRAR